MDTTQQPLRGINVAIRATDGVEEAKLTGPARALGQTSAKVDVIAPHEGRIQAFKHLTCGRARSGTRNQSQRRDSR
jgi:hypothetical protein